MILESMRKFERWIILVLILMMSFVLLLATLELGWIIGRDVITPPLFFLEIDELLEIFGLFMLVIIGVELLESIIKTYLAEKTVRVEVVMTVAIIAIARKVIILDVKDLPSMSLIGIASIIAALGAAYFLIRRNRVQS